MKALSRFRIFMFVQGIIFFIPQFAMGQTQPQDAIRENTPNVHALINSRIVQSPDRIIEKGTIILRDGIITDVGESVKIPEDARIWDYSGLTVYPGFIESYMPVKLEEKTGSKNGTTSLKPAYWNPNVHPEESAFNCAPLKDTDLQALRNQGITAAVLIPEDGIFSGSSVLISLGEGTANSQVLKQNVAQNIHFSRPPRSGELPVYPASQMGVIALIRQTFLDADWYDKAQRAYVLNQSSQIRPETNLALQALALSLKEKQPFAFRTFDDLNSLRALKVAREFGLNVWLVGNGEEYRQLTPLKNANVPLIIPVNFPPAPDVDSPEDAVQLSLRELNHWDSAPLNARFLKNADIPFSFSSVDLKNKSDFLKNIRKTVERGLPPEDALAALTMVPATVLGMDDKLGSIDTGKLAHLIVCYGDIFAKENSIFSLWINGKIYEIQKKPQFDLAGAWDLNLQLPQQNLMQELVLSGKAGKLSGALKSDSLKISVNKIALDFSRISMVFLGDSLGLKGMVRLSGKAEANHLTGSGMLADGSVFKWNAKRKSAMESKNDTRKKPNPDLNEPLSVPLDAYAYRHIPAQQPIVFVQNATIWTSSEKGLLEEADLLIVNGKITEVGKNLTAPAKALIIDARGKHVTPGLIDAHSHTAISQGVNEGTQAVTSEVRIEDVINPEDIGLYRELAGGLTIINQLHGSANPIGGQNSVIKLRWGADAEGLRVRDAIPGIKFALGENVKQSNWGEKFTTRYPQTRMGVEQIIFDRFKAAQDYELTWQKYNERRDKTGIIPPRRDLELEALVEILNGKRLIHSHSYRQDEILMLTRLAEYFNFQIGTFQHVLEGYKVAEALAQHGAGASTFSDWWAYKFEVYDAIPYNGAIMHEAGVLVSFNSDDNELARRMNLEAAKAVKYGGVPEQEALKFVTLNPAKQLRIDHRVGSLEKGKDGDFVVWSGHPLSSFSRCEQTWIEGRKYFDLENDLQMRDTVEKERQRLIQKVLISQNKPAGGLK
ncbi:MAG: amidohydrolase family protein [Deferribacteres bacterium]|nr:amidohydrolase family protein [candidate division KSB1 bacterium]MCB9504133.1 amidohydrolase family protein [Deferribacteres bacterium]